MPQSPITQKQAANGQWTAMLRSPHLALRQFLVGQYAGWVETTAQPVVRQELPTLFVPVILGFHAPFSVAGVSRLSFLAGAHRGPTTVGSIGHVECLQFNLTFDGACRLLGADLGVMTDCVAGAGDVLGQLGRDLIEQLGNTPCWSARFDLLDEYLLRHVPDAPGLSTEVAWSLDILAGTNGGERIGVLARDIGWSRKRLIHRFRREIGLPPKLIARLMRLHSAIGELSKSSRDLAEIALDAGYADQAHFNRDFRAFSGTTPARFRKALDPELESLRAV